jgi:NADH dehydrogenase (ubiquinone) 1 alpha subcomplex subunit 9
MFGWEDKLLNTLASPGNLLTSNSLHERLWPVHAVDVGKALEKMMHDDTTASETYELYGPKNYSMAEISELVDREIVKRRRHINIPKAIRQPLAKYINRLLWWPVGSADEVEREFINQTIDPTAKTLADLEIEPAELEALIFQYLVRFTQIPKKK